MSPLRFGHHLSRSHAPICFAILSEWVARLHKGIAPHYRLPFGMDWLNEMMGINWAILVPTLSK